jgi:hypothetical protein
MTDEPKSTSHVETTQWFDWSRIGRFMFGIVAVMLPWKPEVAIFLVFALIFGADFRRH